MSLTVIQIHELKTKLKELVVDYSPSLTTLEQARNIVEKLFYEIAYGGVDEDEGDYYADHYTTCDECGSIMSSELNFCCDECGNQNDKEEYTEPFMNEAFEATKQALRNMKKKE